MIKYKLVRRGPKYCVRVKGTINTTRAFGFCHDRKMSYHIKRPGFKTGEWNIWKTWPPKETWDYDFIFDKEYEATAFIIGFL